MCDPLRERIADLLDRNGITNYAFVRRSKHPAVIVTVAGVTHIHTYPGSPSDHRSLLNNLYELRRQLGLVPTRKVKPANTNRPKARPKRRPKCTYSYRPQPPGRVEPVADRFHAPLAALKAQMMAQAPTPVANACHAEDE